MRYLDCGCCIDDAGRRHWCPTCSAGATSKVAPLAALVRRLDRYSEVPGMGMEKDALGPWLKREDVLRVVDAGSGT